MYTRKMRSNCKSTRGNILLSLTMVSAIILIVFIPVFVYGMDRTKFSKIPSPMPGYNLQKTFGRWYYQYRMAPCSWSGSIEFTDFEIDRRPETDQTVLFTLTMRNGICNRITGRAYIESPPGVFRLKDMIGNVFSGLHVIVAEDPKSYSIGYGCTKMSVLGDRCDDPSVSVKTRVPYPDKKVIAQINLWLMKLWGVTVNELHHIQYRQSCLNT